MYLLPLFIDSRLCLKPFVLMCCMLWNEIRLYVSAMLFNHTVSSTFGLQSVSFVSLL
jgi:hypothetical protein